MCWKILHVSNHVQSFSHDVYPRHKIINSIPLWSHLNTLEQFKGHAQCLCLPNTNLSYKCLIMALWFIMLVKDWDSYSILVSTIKSLILLKVMIGKYPCELYWAWVLLYYRSCWNLIVNYWNGKAIALVLIWTPSKKQTTNI